MEGYRPILVVGFTIAGIPADLWSVWSGPMNHFWRGFNIVFGSLFPAFTYWCIVLGMGYV